MTGPDPQREPESETVEKKSIAKTHEEYIAPDGPSMTKQEYERHKEQERQKAREKSDRNPPDASKARPASDQP